MDFFIRLITSEMLLKGNSAVMMINANDDMIPVEKSQLSYHQSPVCKQSKSK